MLLSKFRNFFSIATLFFSLIACSTHALAEPASSPSVAPVLIDVRSHAEFEAGHLTDAINIDIKEIEQKIVQLYPDKKTPLNLYCRSGSRSGMAKIALENLGYTDVTNIGAYDALKDK